MADMSDFNTVMDMATAETINSEVPQVSISETYHKAVVRVKTKMYTQQHIVYRSAKAYSRDFLQQIRTTTDPDEMSRLVARLFFTYNGIGLHPLSAIRSLAKFPSHFDAAISHLFETMHRVTNSFMGNPEAFAKSLRTARGNPSRYFKNFDATLASIICTRWQLSIQTGGEWDWRPQHLESQIAGTGATLYARLCTFSPATHFGTAPSKLLAESKSYFPVSKRLLAGAAQYSLAVAKVHRVAGHRLPPELLDMIIDALHQQHDDLGILKLYNSHTYSTTRLFVASVTTLAGQRIKCILMSTRQPLKTRK